MDSGTNAVVEMIGLCSFSVALDSATVAKKSASRLRFGGGRSFALSHIACL
jgi:hypothetical protein